MRKLSLSVCLACAFFVASAVAQMTPGGGQGAQNSSPSMSQPSQQQQPGGMNQPDANAPGTQTDQNTNTANQNQNNGEHKLKGCVQSQGGQYMLETKKGKTVALAGQDVSAQVGHEVRVKGTWESGMSATSSSNSGSSGKTFNVTEVKMVSDTCGGKSQSGSMDHSSGSANGTSSPNTGTSSSPSSQPPQ
jgi:hypothetical protein